MRWNKPSVWFYSASYMYVAFWLTFSHCLIFAEYMPGGSLYDYLHKNHNVLKLPHLLKFAIDVCKGMEYLHQNNIIHRDLKTANLLMDTQNVRILIWLVRFKLFLKWKYEIFCVVWIKFLSFGTLYAGYKDSLNIMFLKFLKKVSRFVCALTLVSLIWSFSVAATV